MQYWNTFNFILLPKLMMVWEIYDLSYILFKMLNLFHLSNVLTLNQYLLSYLSYSATYGNYITSDVTGNVFIKKMV